MTVLALCLISVSSTQVCAEELWTFVDEGGQFHFGDAPSDPRHRLIDLPGRAQPRTTRRQSGSRVNRAPDEFLALIKRVAIETRLEPALLEAIVHTESGFNPIARSPKGALGLMQLMPATARLYGVRNPLDPEQNLAAGALHLRALLQQFNSLPLALAAYNAGADAVGRHGNRIPPFSETQAYVPKVMRHYDLLRSKTTGDPTADARRMRRPPLSTRSATPCC
jgi:soluble lytic murein transglycosylase